MNGQKVLQLCDMSNSDPQKLMSTSIDPRLLMDPMLCELVDEEWSQEKLPADGGWDPTTAQERAGLQHYSCIGIMLPR